MKKALLTVLILTVALMASPVFAEFTAEEEVVLRKYITHIDKVEAVVKDQPRLKEIVDTLGLETVPLTINGLRKDREAKIAERDVAIQAVQAKAISDVNALMDSFEVEIDAIESAIRTEEGKL